VLLYRNGDAARGSVAAFGPEGVTFAADGGAPRAVPFKDLAAVGFNPRFARPRKPKGPYARLTLADGTRFDATAVALKDGEVVAKPLLGPEVAVPVAKFVALDVLQGGAVYLSDLKPTKSEVSGFVGAGWPWAADRTVRGNPLRVLAPAGESTFDRGLGTHPRTTLTYALNGDYVRFEALVGLDAGTGKRGRASVRVLLDGKPADLPDLKALTAGPAVPVKLDVRGAKELTLEVDFGPTGDVQADVNWAGARLIRK
jgi:NPCBM/NEW2 domain